MDITYGYAADIAKAERDSATGDLLVYGKATGPQVDLDAQVCDPAWLKSAMPRWMEWGNVREMHQPIAAGVGIELAAEGDDWMLLSRVIDENTAKKIEAGALKGYSIGIKGATVVKDADAPGGRIIGGEVVEVSYVDRPCLPSAKLAIAKVAGAEQLAPVDAEGHVLDVEKREQETVTLGDLAKVVSELVTVVKSSLAAGEQAGGVGEGEEGGGGAAGSTARPTAKTANPDLIRKSEVADLVKDAVAEATKAHKAELESLRAELAKVKATPVPGGPVIRPTATTTAQSETAKTAAYYRQMADQIADPETRRGYLDLAAQAERAGN